jgi:acetyltransferase-like isoleucine patch superfamily enzyme
LRGDGCLVFNKGKITIGHNALITSKAGFFTHLPFSKIKVGDNCIFHGVQIHARSQVTIGDYCMFAQGSALIDNNSHNTSVDPIKRRFGEVKAEPIVLKRNVWVCTGALILKGVTIGENSIVAAKAVVSHDIPANEVWGGNPAVFLKKLA